jgi:hypothetical protein
MVTFVVLGFDAREQAAKKGTARARPPRCVPVSPSIELGAPTFMTFPPLHVVRTDVCILWGLALKIRDLVVVVIGEVVTGSVSVAVSRTVISFEPYTNSCPDSDLKSIANCSIRDGSVAATSCRRE